MVMIGRTATISKAFNFSAAHHLPNHEGLCRNPHGHNYRLVVHVHGLIGRVDPDKPTSSEGMVYDYKDLSHVVRSILLPELDHQDLNETLVATGLVPLSTAEEVATYILYKLRKHIPGVVCVELSETPDTNCVITAETPGI